MMIPLGRRNEPYDAKDAVSYLYNELYHDSYCGRTRAKIADYFPYLKRLRTTTWRRLGKEPRFGRLPFTPKEWRVITAARTSKWWSEKR